LERDRLVPFQDLMGQKFNRRVTEYWWRVHDLILRNNPEASAVLARFNPSKV
jgi:hypothetical protein